MNKHIVPISILIIGFFSLVLFSCSSKKKAITAENAITNKALEIYILMGQSNMAGRGPLAPEDSIIQNKNVLMLTKDLKWVSAKNPLHFDKPGITAVGPGLSFGLAMQEANKKVVVGLVPTAVGGTSINSWIPGGYDKATNKYPWDDAEKRIIEAMKYGTIKGILWHQGESDSKLENAAVYLPKLEDLIKRVRILVGNDKLPFVVGQLGKYNLIYDNINKETAKLPALVPFTAIATSEGLTDKGDNTHFNRASAIILGERFAKKMLGLQKEK
ncbi:MAG: sialate O-acetylesterase [Oligoflexus sp.]|nr:sialate O-acetylesterase [Pseudopedobacter sp.]